MSDANDMLLDLDTHEYRNINRDAGVEIIQTTIVINNRLMRAFTQVSSAHSQHVNIYCYYE